MSAQFSPLSDQFNARAAREGWPSVCHAHLAFDSGTLNELLAVWQTARGTRPLPMRSDFTARMLLHHLPNIAIVECVPEYASAHRYRFRLVGSGLTRYTGETTGKFLDEVIPPAFLESWSFAFDTVLALRMPLRFVSQFRSLALDYMTSESLAAPLCDAQGMPCAILSSVVYTARVK